ncbi:penicillin-insensitive murein endopeptidase [Paraliomyxa miuraensis]|uniref:penicillin-insensitive murein endopeptidase n=1 Tax=Paraliomyxa miuraensis TaxID=376150 RepID=UPI002251D443|nr:penicillin-insensitive murein endopeptidase [Paraliomyxa miuraensis]MCX4241578.1 penicillin-insensitive murein endopeptidase [Paraliomyxa miuraensis]
MARRDHLITSVLVLGLAVGGTTTAWLAMPMSDQTGRVVQAASMSSPPAPAHESLVLSTTQVDASGDHTTLERTVPQDPASEHAAPESLDAELVLDAKPPQAAEEAEETEETEETESDPPLRFDDVDIEYIEGTRPWVIHRILRVETLEQVAHRYDATPQAVRNWNGLAPDATPPAGLRVKLKAKRVPPTRKRVGYTVKPGDTWWSIGTAHGIDSRDLRTANWTAPNRLAGGERITLWIDPVVHHWIHEGESATEAEGGAVGIRRGAVGVGPPWEGRLINGVRIPEGAGWRRKMMPSSYGTTHAVTNLVKALQKFHAEGGYERDVLLGSMSWPHGGPMKGHRSHQTGRDLDIWLPLLARYPSWTKLEPRRIDYEALWKLVAALLDTGEVEMLFLDHELQRRLHKAATKLGVDRATLREVIQWPRGATAHAGSMRHESGHEDHIHVRFRCGPHETECAAGRAPGRDGG